MCQRWFWPVLSILCLALAACGSGGNDDGPDEQPGGAGGSDGGGGSGGDEGGSGGKEPVDNRAPLITISFPVNTNLEAAHVTVRGFATDDKEVVAIRATVRGNPVEIAEFDPARKVDFSFGMDVAEGRNEVIIEAEDAAGNVGRFSQIYFPLPPRQVPEIERLDINPAFPTPGEPVTISWSIKAVPDANVWLTIGSAPRTRENMVGSRTIVIHEPHRELLQLTAQNEEGSVEERLYISMGGDLRIWPTGATVATGATQRFVAPNAIGNVTWTRDGAPMDGGIFHADRPGTFQIVGTTDEEPTRTTSTTITVSPATGPTFSFRGIGGQFATQPGSIGTAPWFEADGSVSTLTPDGSAVATWDRVSLSWRFQQLPIAAHHRLVASSGETWLVGPGKVARFAAGSGTQQIFVMPWNEGLGPSLSIGDALPDGAGGLWIALNLPARAELWHVGAAGATTLVDDEIDGNLTSLLLDGDDTLWALRDGTDGVWLVRHAASEGLTDVSAVPLDATHLALLADGGILATGGGIGTFAGGEWTLEIGRYPGCDVAACSFGKPLVRNDGTVLVPVTDGIYSRQANGTVHRMGLSAQELPFGVGGAGNLTFVAEGADGSLVTMGTFGVFRLGNQASNWQVLGNYALLPGSEIRSISVQRDGGWLLGGGGPLRQGRFHRSVHRKIGNVWEALADESVITQSIVAIDSTETGGLLIAAAANGAVYALHDTGTIALPGGSGVGVTRTLGVSKLGAVFLSDGERNRVARITPETNEWTPETGLSCGQAYAKDLNDNLWAADCGQVKRLEESGAWTLQSLGLPMAHGQVFGTRHLAVDEAGTFWLSTEQGVFRRVAGSNSWVRAGFGTPSVEASFIAAGGGRTIALASGIYYDLSADGRWLPLAPQPSGAVGPFAVTADGEILMGHGSLGLLLGSEVR